MTRSTFRVLFYIKRTKKINKDVAPIYMRITVNGRRVEIAIHQNINPANWDSVRGRLLGMTMQACTLNAHLEMLQAKVYSIKRELEEKSKTVTAEAVRDAYLGIQEEKKTLLGVFGEHNERCRQLLGKDFSAGTIERYETVYRLLQLFMRSKYNKKDLSLDEINHKFIKDFEFYLKVSRNCGHNTSTKYLKNFKKITREAIVNGYMTHDPFTSIKFHLEVVDQEYLEEPELRKLMNKEFDIERLQVTKDIFVFCCLTGLAYTDIEKLTYDKITEKGIDWNIKAKREKSKSKFYVPLLEPAKKIMEKYRNHPRCIKSGLVLPVPSNQHMNGYLKEIAALCGINKRLTTHCGRRTFASTVALANGLPIDLIRVMLGHKSSIVTWLYAKFAESTVKKEMDKVDAIYKTTAVKIKFPQPCNN